MERCTSQGLYIMKRLNRSLMLLREKNNLRVGISSESYSLLNRQTLCGMIYILRALYEKKKEV
jgi:hypothetical protein